jgi:hypothetical protein
MPKTPSLPTLEIAETDEIAALLAELMPASESKPPAVRPALPPPVAEPAPDPVETAVAPPAEPVASPPAGHLPLREVLDQTNWRNAMPLGQGQPYDGPFPAPIGVLTLDELFDLVNWNNQPEDVQPLPQVGILPPPAGHEWTVASVLSQFAWD